MIVVAANLVEMRKESQIFSVLKERKTMNRLVLVAFIAVCLLGCVYKSIPYQPRQLSPAQALDLVPRLLREQEAAAYELQDVEVTPEFFKISYYELKNTKFLFINQGITSIPSSKFVYFDNIGSIELSKKKLYAVVLRDTAGIELFKYYTSQEQKASQFISAVLTLGGQSASIVNGK